MQDNKYDVAVLGASGTVGEAMMAILAERQFPVRTLYPLASHRSAGNTVFFKNRSLEVLDVETFDFSKVQIALFSAGKEASSLYAIRAVEAGCIVIDNTSCFRMEPDVPLVIPEVNPAAISDFRERGIIANPNCSTIQMLVALKPLYDAVGITRINVATYQAVSGSGKSAIQELAGQVGDLLNGITVDPSYYPKQIAFNVLPQIGAFEENGYTQEEMKIVRETHKILGDPTIMVNPTAVRVPVFYGHAEAIHLETRQKITAEEVRELLRQSPGIIVMDERTEGSYPSPIPDVVGTDAVFVGRIREDLSHPLGLNLWVVSDNVRKGAALNAVQIAEILINSYL
jgi:aspartate-semialdehyde dehydrogenase